MKDIIAVIIEKLQVSYMVFAAVFTLLVWKIWSLDVIWLFIIGGCVYLASMWGVAWGHHLLDTSYYRKKNKNDEIEDKKALWIWFYGLNDSDFTNILTLYNSELVPNISNVRVLKTNLHLCNDITLNDCMHLRTSKDSQYRPVVVQSMNRLSATIWFDPYICELLDAYIRTGIKQQV